MAQTRKNMRSTKPKPFKESDISKLIKKKRRDVYIKIYDVEVFRNTIYSNQTGQFLKQLLHRKKYIMVMVDIDSNAILVELTKSRKNNKMKHAYKYLLLRLKRARVLPKKHVFCNKGQIL